MIELGREIAHLQKLQAKHRENIRSLEEMLASYGMERPLPLLSNLEFEQEQLRQVEERLATALAERGKVSGKEEPAIRIGLPVWGWGVIALAAALVIGGTIFLVSQGGEPTVTPVPVVQATTPIAATTAAARATDTPESLTNTPTPELTDAPTSAPVLPTSTPKLTLTYTPTPTSTPTPISTPAPRPLPFEDNFDMGPRPEWEPMRGTWRMVDGKYTADPSDAWSLTFVGDVGWTDYAVDVDVFYYTWDYPVRIIVRAQDGSYMALETGSFDTDWILFSEGDSRVVAHSDKGGLTTRGGWHKNHLRIEVKGIIYTAYSDDTMLLRAQDDSFENGRVGLAFKYRRENTPRFDNFRVTELH